MHKFIFCLNVPFPVSFSFFAFFSIILHNNNCLLQWDLSSDHRKKGERDDHFTTTSAQLCFIAIIRETSVIKCSPSYIYGLFSHEWCEWGKRKRYFHSICSLQKQFDCVQRNLKDEQKSIYSFQDHIFFEQKMWSNAHDVLLWTSHTQTHIYRPKTYHHS